MQPDKTAKPSDDLLALQFPQQPSPSDKELALADLGMPMFAGLQQWAMKCVADCPATVHVKRSPSGDQVFADWRGGPVAMIPAPAWPAVRGCSDIFGWQLVPLGQVPTPSGGDAVMVLRVDRLASLYDAAQSKPRLQLASPGDVASLAGQDTPRA